VYVYSAVVNNDPGRPVSEVFILAHYDPPSTETPTTETTIVQCHKNSWISQFNKYLLLVTFETNDNYSIRFEMKKTIRTALITWQWSGWTSNSQPLDH